MDFQKHIREKSHQKNLKWPISKFEKDDKRGLEVINHITKIDKKSLFHNDLAFENIYSEPKSPWNEKLVIDGGMGTELYALGAKEIYGSHQLWSAQANHESPDLVTEAHRRYGYLNSLCTMKI